jgi:hypothetical protein
LDAAAKARVQAECLLSGSAADSWKLLVDVQNLIDVILGEDLRPGPNLSGRQHPVFGVLISLDDGVIAIEIGLQIGDEQDLAVAQRLERINRQTKRTVDDLVFLAELLDRRSGR